ncbi:MAG: AMIN-like domain-containing (lipo)protein [Arenimonas sp.]
MKYELCEKVGPYSAGALVFLFALLCAGCGKQQVPATEAAVKTLNETSVGQANSDTAKPTAGISMAGRTNSGYAMQFLKALRVGNQAGVDRMVFEFTDAGLPEWEVKYVDQPLLDCGSGEAVSVAGGAWLQIAFRGAQAHTEAGEETGGPRRRVVNQKLLHELVRVCDFEGEVIWVAGIAHKNAYKAQVFADPSRLVIDILH